MAAACTGRLLSARECDNTLLSRGEGGEGRPEQEQAWSGSTDFLINYQNIPDEGRSRRSGDAGEQVEQKEQEVHEAEEEQAGASPPHNGHTPEGKQSKRPAAAANIPPGGRSAGEERPPGAVTAGCGGKVLESSVAGALVRESDFHCYRVLTTGGWPQSACDAGPWAAGGGAETAPAA